MNQHSDIHVLYSNLSFYTEMKHDEKLEWSVKTDDFFPYANDQNSFWYVASLCVLVCSCGKLNQSSGQDSSPVVPH